MKIANDYDRWALKYDRDINPTRDLDKIVTKRSLYNKNFSSVLELGCGTGKNTQWLITRAKELFGIDFSKNMLKIAKKRLGLKGLLL